MTASTLVQMRVPDDLLTRIDQAAEGSNRTAWILAAAARELDGSATSAPDTSVGGRHMVTYPSVAARPPRRRRVGVPAWFRRRELTEPQLGRYGVIDAPGWSRGAPAASQLAAQLRLNHEALILEAMPSGSRISSLLDRLDCRARNSAS
jgi:hypothetical protein